MPEPEPAVSGPVSHVPILDATARRRSHSAIPPRSCNARQSRSPSPRRYTQTSGVVLREEGGRFFRISRSRRNSRFSFRSCAISSRSAVVKPVLPWVRSACAWRTHWDNADAVRSSSRATLPIVFPSSKTSLTAPALNSSENRRRSRLARLPASMLDIVSTFQKVSTRSGQAQTRRAEQCAEADGSAMTHRAALAAHPQCSADDLEVEGQRD